jgi:hypothetical protein
VPWELDLYAGKWQDRVATKNEESRRDSDKDSSSNPLQEGYFVYGTTTPQSVVDGMSDVSIGYSGKTLSGNRAMGATINFGDKTWTAWVDNATGLGKNAFTAIGHLDGANMITEGLAGAPSEKASVKGVLGGALYGNGAQVLAGGYEIVKTVGEVVTFHGKYAPTIVPGYTANSADVFVAVATVDTSVVSTPK